jgi:hypothetical protein
MKKVMGMFNKLLFTIVEFDMCWELLFDLPYSIDPLQEDWTRTTPSIDHGGVGTVCSSTRTPPAKLMAKRTP